MARIDFGPLDKQRSDSALIELCGARVVVQLAFAPVGDPLVACLANGGDAAFPVKRIAAIV